ncbi:hypothetical protein DFH28DRAFT_922218 [Melampsora americana]|nr:hypothetical protein DFH28DRAFT_922218 [Melampsora americana]
MPPLNPNKLTSASASSSQPSKSKPISSNPKTHIRFHSDEEEEEGVVMRNSLENEDFEVNESNEESSSNEESNEMKEDSDEEGPEVISTSVSKRDVMEKENLRNTFQRSVQIAKKKANRARDEKLKKLKSQSTQSNLTLSHPTSFSSSSSSSNEEEEEEEEPNSSINKPIQSNKKYLDPSLFVSASKILKESKRSIKEKEMKEIQLKMKKRKRNEKANEEDRREIGNHTTIIKLNKSTHLTPTIRPERVSRFVKNRLSHSTSHKSPHQLPKLTLNAKRSMGSRQRSSRSHLLTRQFNRPDLLFVRQPKSKFE